MKIKLNDIIKKNRLKLSTAQYVLKNPELLPGLPATGSQGRHREFSIQQALRLGTCCHLVMLGLPLRRAAKVLKFIEHQIRTTQPKNFGRRLTYMRGDFTEPWTVELFDCRFVRVWYGDLDGEYPARYLYLDLETGKTSKFRFEPDRLIYSEINLTEIEAVLTKE